MLISEIGNFFNPELIRVVAEIQLNNAGEESLCQELCKDKNAFHSNGFDDIKSFLRGHSYQEIDTVIKGINRYLLINYNNVYRDYISIGRVKNQLKRSIETNNNNYDFDRVLVEFIKYFEDHCANSYTFSGSLQGYIYNAFSYFKNSKSKEIYSIINERGMNIQVDGDEIGLEEQLEVSFKESKKDVDFNFQECVKSIYDASVLMFPGEKKTGKNVWSSIVELYRIYISESKMDSLEDSIQNMYYPKKKKVRAGRIMSEGLYFPVLRIQSPVDSDPRDYRVNTYRTRKEMLSKAFRYVDMHLSGEDVKAIFEHFVSTHDRVASSKNETKLFNSSEIVEADRANISTFMTVLEGVTAVSNLKEYCRIIGISIFDIPNEVFIGEKYYKRFVTLEDCLKYYKYTSELITTESSSPGVIDNDTVYDQLKSKSSYNFLSIKHIIEGVFAPKPEVDLRTLINKVNIYLKVCTTTYNYIDSLGLYKDITKQGLLDYFNLIKSGDIEQLKSKRASFEHLIKSLNNDSSKLPVPFILGDNDLAKSYIKLARYVNLSIITTAKVFLCLRDLSSTNYDILQKLSKEELIPLPTTIDSEFDLIKLNNHVSSLVNYGYSDLLKYEDIEEYKELYNSCYAQLRIPIDYVNNKILEHLKNFSKNNISINSTAVDLELQKAGLVVYDMKPNPLKNLNNFKCMCSVSNEGFLVKDGKIHRTFEGYYVHENGYFIIPKSYSAKTIPQGYIFN